MYTVFAKTAEVNEKKRPTLRKVLLIYGIIKVQRLRIY
jgi:hypothetical protein